MCILKSMKEFKKEFDSKLKNKMVKFFNQEYRVLHNII